MFRFILLIIATFGVNAGCKVRSSDRQDSGLRFYGANNQRARLTFSGHFLMDVSTSRLSPTEAARKDELQETIQQQAWLQLRYLIGEFKHHRAYRQRAGTPFGRPKIDVSHYEVLTTKGAVSRIKVSYQFSDEVVFDDYMFANLNAQGQVVIPIQLPLVPEDFAKYSTSAHHCTAEHDGDPANKNNFWYYWYPDADDWCRKHLADDPQIMLTVQDAVLEPMPSTRMTFPEYDRLGKDNKITMYIIMGKKGGTFFESNDEGVQAYRNLKSALAETWTPVERPKTGAFRHFSAATSAMLTKQLGKKTVTIKLFLVDIYEGGDPLAELSKEALENGDVFAYEGHSNLGWGFNPEKFVKAKYPLSLPKDRYQIFFFGSCNTFAYYTKPYFDLKQSPDDPTGTKNLDIISSARGTSFTVYALVLEQFTSLLFSGEQYSWQKIINNIFDRTDALTQRDKVDRSGSIHVVGDEDPGNKTVRDESD